MAKYIRYHCALCKSTVEMRDSGNDLKPEASVACPKLGCSGRAALVWYE